MNGINEPQFSLGGLQEGGQGAVTNESQRFTAGGFYVRVDCEDVQYPFTVYGEVLAVEGPGPWVRVREYCDEQRHGYEEEVALTSGPWGVVIQLTPAAFARARRLGFPNFAKAVVHAQEAEEEWLWEHGFDGHYFDGQGRLQKGTPEVLTESEREEVRSAVANVLGEEGVATHRKPEAGDSPMRQGGQF